MADEKNLEVVLEEEELELDDLDQVSGGSMRNVRVRKTSDITDNMKKNI